MNITRILIIIPVQARHAIGMIYDHDKKVGNFMFRKSNIKT